MYTLKYCNWDKYHFVDIFLCDHQYLALKEYGLNSCKRHGPKHDILALLQSDDFPFICSNCEINECKGIKRKRLEKYINYEISFRTLMLHTLKVL